ncbi:short-chain dehydrogenase-like protein [Lophiostoma macrostomum CBS 122681]|uniref:Short-chain dehydrogenase-like protein n=1 Tax=Lophiostoma macrostomum CBS 122681 TaxID=1314788 RepID=A0A6A6SHM6_9PLEO|nr:short-chain dehydrogenase-like protein [Lophiostoma macrostomum CBS 122681]
MSTYLITGTSRGLGLSVAKKLLLQPVSEVSKIIAAARSESDALKAVISGSDGRVEYVPLEITDEEQIEEAVSLTADILGDNGLDVLINNAGIMPFTQGGIANMTDLKHVFEVNVLSVHNLTTAFIPLLEKGKLKRIINISTAMGSITQAPNYSLTPHPAYKIAKAALNMLTVQWHLAKYDDRFSFIASSLWVKTDLGGEIADLELEEAVSAITERLLHAGRQEAGKFLNIHVKGWENGKPGKHNYYDGKELPW